MAFQKTPPGNYSKVRLPLRRPSIGFRLAYDYVEPMSAPNYARPSEVVS